MAIRYVDKNPQLNTTSPYLTAYTGRILGSRQSTARVRNPYYISPADKASAALKEDRSKLTTEYQSAYDTAKAANEARYEDVLSRYGSRYNTAVGDLDTLQSDVLGGLEGLGQAEKAGIRRTYGQSGALAAQGLINSGLHSTTIAPTIQRQNTDAMNRALSITDEKLRRERLGYVSDLGKTRLGYTTGLSKEKLDFMERRTDAYPDQSMYINLMNQLGNTGN